MSASSSVKNFLTIKPLRLVGAISAAVVAIVASITLMVGIDSRPLRLMTLLLAWIHRLDLSDHFWIDRHGS